MAIRLTDNPPAEAHVDMVVCHRVVDIPIPSREGAVIRHCTKCSERIWVAPNSPKGPPLVCVPCAKAAIEADGDEPTILISERTLHCAGPETRRAIASLLDSDDD
jgi:hypothetical protein